MRDIKGGGPAPVRKPVATLGTSIPIRHAGCKTNRPRRPERSRPRPSAGPVSRRIPGGSGPGTPSRARGPKGGLYPGLSLELPNRKLPQGPAPGRRPMTHLQFADGLSRQRPVATLTMAARALAVQQPYNVHPGIGPRDFRKPDFRMHMPIVRSVIPAHRFPAPDAIPASGLAAPRQPEATDPQQHHGVDPETGPPRRAVNRAPSSQCRSSTSPGIRASLPIRALRPINTPATIPVRSRSRSRGRKAEGVPSRPERSRSHSPSHTRQIAPNFPASPTGGVPSRS